MSGVTFDFDVSLLLNDLHRIADPSFVDKTANWIGGYMVREIRKHFDSSTQWDDTPMTPAKDGRKTLVKSQALLNSYGNYETNGGSVFLGSDSPYAAYHHEGTQPYVIMPSNKLALHFMIGGGMQFAKKVNHPGLVARPVLGVNPRNEQMIIKYITKQLLGE